MSMTIAPRSTTVWVVCSSTPATTAGTPLAPPGTSWPTNTPMPWPSRRPPRTSLPSSSTPEKRGLRVAPQGTGHNATAIASLDRTVLVKTSRMRQVVVDPSTRTARIGAGALWEDVVTAAHEHGLAALSGSSPDVGAVGYTLGGGVSWLARTYGLSCNNVRSIDVVTADGRLVQAGPDNEPELFWALRGGGGSFGIVTGMELALFPIAEVFAARCSGPWTARPRSCTPGSS
jgi:FAD/FMN-containing dehydrogenase